VLFVSLTLSLSLSMSPYKMPSSSEKCSYESDSIISSAVSASFCFVAIPMLLEVTQLFIMEKNQQCINPSVSKPIAIPRHMHFIAEREQTKLSRGRLTWAWNHNTKNQELMYDQWKKFTFCPTQHYQVW